MSKSWFVIMNQNEVERFKNQPIARLVYEGIKSMCGNGKLSKACSTREIAQRGNVSQMAVIRHLPWLLANNFISINGDESRVGGKVPVFKVNLTDSASESSRGLSETDTASKHIQSKKEIINTYNLPPGEYLNANGTWNIVSQDGTTRELSEEEYKNLPL